MSKKHVYELIPQGYPVKLYFDLEYLIEYNPWTTMTIAAAKLHELTQQLLVKIFNRRGLHDVIYLDATTSKKASVHLIYPDVIFENMTHLKEFIRKLQQFIHQRNLDETFRIFKPNGDTELEEDSLIDWSPYKPDQLFRIYGSSKLTKKNHLYPVGGPSEVDPMLLFQSLVSVPCGVFGCDPKQFYAFKSITGGPFPRKQRLKSCSSPEVIRKI